MASPEIRVLSSGMTLCMIGANAAARLPLSALRDAANSSFCMAAVEIADWMPRKAAYRPAIKKVLFNALLTLLPSPPMALPMPLDALLADCCPFSMAF